MPSAFRCNDCDLRFIVGWSDAAAGRDGYGAVTNLVCSVCGTEHAVEIALRDRGPERIRFFDVTLQAVDEPRRVAAMRVLRSRFDLTPEEARDALQSLPMLIAHRVVADIAEELEDVFSPFSSVHIEEIDSEPNPLHGPLRQDNFLSGIKPRFVDDRRLHGTDASGRRAGANGEFDLEEQPCACCKTRGSLLDDPAEIGERCPHCGERAVECVDSWTT